ncbi:GvpL/GvpF family gas vesicle protein [Streptomyces sp. NPDC002004]
MTADGRLRYVYAVTRPFDGVLPDGTGGLGGEPPRLLHHGGLVAVVDDVPARDFSEDALKEHLEDLDWLAATARAHEAVVAALTTVTTTVPLRLATVCLDDSGVRRLLESAHDGFLRALDRLEGRVEWGVKVYAGLGAAQPVGSTGGDPSAPRPAGRDYLRRRLAERRAAESGRREATELAQELHRRLTALSEEQVLHRPQDARISGVPGENILNAAYLVPRAHCEEFARDVEAVNATTDDAVRVQLTGPWAPYSFARLGTEEPDRHE